MLARYSGSCPECGDDIFADLDEIVITDDGAVHENCAPEPATFPL